MKISIMTGALLSLLVAGVIAAPAALAATIPPTPEDLELQAGADSSITLEWLPSAGATSYRIYRGTTSGGEGATAIATTNGTDYKDTGLSSTPIYFYQVTAVNSAGESARTPEDASKTPPPIGTGGDVPGVTVGDGKVYYCKDALLGGFDWFQTLTGWFPSVLGSSGSTSPNQRVVDMAYAEEGTMTFTNVVVPTAGLYTVDWRYAFQSGLFPGVNNRQMGLKVNGTVITRTQSFPITGSFDVYLHSALQVRLNAGVNSVQMFAVSDHGLSRVDQLTVTPATASSPAGPATLTATAGDKSVRLSWAASTSGSPAEYRVYRGTKSDGEVSTPVATVSGTTTTFTDTGLQNGKQYFYFVSAWNAVGGSPNSPEATATPVVAGSPPASPSPRPSSSASPAPSPSASASAPKVPFGVVITPQTGQILLQWGYQANISGYNVYRGTTPGGEGATPYVTVTSPTYIDRGVVVGQTYYYQFTAFTGSLESARTQEFPAHAN
jgi:fibronectin type 3 domain-containing protein